MSTRNISIDILKFFAVLLITNSHFSTLYVFGQQLATGGAIGDALFFFASGFCLFLSRRKDNFMFFYKRRISRIYPTIFSWAILSSFLLGNQKSMCEIVISGGGWFVSCIMVYYVFTYFIHKKTERFSKLLCGVWALCMIPLFFLLNHGENIYSDGLFRFCFFFLFMLMGMILSCRQMLKIEKPGLELAKILVCASIFYGVSFLAAKRPSLNALQLLTIPALMGLTYYLWRLSNCDFLARLYNSKIIGFVIKLIGGLCLEIYVVQHQLITDKMNFLFPLNLLLMLAIIVMAAYVLKCCSTFFSQTFKDQEYNWKDIFKLLSY